MNYYSRMYHAIQAQVAKNLFKSMNGDFQWIVWPPCLPHNWVFMRHHEEIYLHTQSCTYKSTSLQMSFNNLWNGCHFKVIVVGVLNNIKYLFQDFWHVNLKTVTQTFQTNCHNLDKILGKALEILKEKTSKFLVGIKRYFHRL